MQLFQDKRTHFKQGCMQIQTEFPFYEPGSTVRGNIFFLIKKEVKCKDVKIEVKGGQKLGFTRFWIEYEGEGENRKAVEKSEKLKKAHKFMHFKEKVYEVPDDKFMPGDYCISFKFDLPKGMPSSIAFKDEHNRQNPKAKIKYFVKATIDDMKCKDVLVVREPPVKYKEGAGISETSNIKTWGCIS